MPLPHPYLVSDPVHYMSRLTRNLQVGQGSRDNLSSRFLYSLFSQFFHWPEMKCFGRACGYTSGFLSLSYTVHTKIAFLHLAVTSILRHTEGAGKKAAVAANTLVLVHYHNSVLSPLFNSASGANGFASRIPAMETGERNSPVRDIRILPLPDIDNRSPFYPRFDIVQALTCYLARLLHATSHA